MKYYGDLLHFVTEDPAEGQIQTSAGSSAISIGRAFIIMSQNDILGHLMVIFCCELTINITVFMFCTF